MQRIATGMLALVSWTGNPSQVQKPQLVDCRSDIPRIRIRAERMSSEHACSLARIAVTLALRGFPQSLPASVHLDNITDITVSQMRIETPSGKIQETFWIVRLGTDKETFDVEVRFSKVRPEIAVTPTHKPLPTR